MDSSSTADVLVVAHRTVATPALLAAISERAERGPARFHLLVPARSSTDNERRRRITQAELVLELALPLLAEAAGDTVQGSWSVRHDPMDAIEDALRSWPFDEIILSTLPSSLSRWLHIDLPRRVAHFGLPVTTVTASERVPASMA